MMMRLALGRRLVAARPARSLASAAAPAADDGPARAEAAAAAPAARYFAPVEVVDGVAIIRIDCPGKVNSISGEMRDAAKALWEREVAPRADVEAAVFISAKDDNFIAGADINMLREFKQQGREDELEQICMDGHDMFDEISRAGKPLVAAIHGSCLGGGLEWALKCDATRGRLAPRPARSRVSTAPSARARARLFAGATTACARRAPRRSSGCPRSSSACCPAGAARRTCRGCSA